MKQLLKKADGQKKSKKENRLKELKELSEFLEDLVKSAPTVPTTSQVASEGPQKTIVSQKNTFTQKITEAMIKVKIKSILLQKKLKALVETGFAVKK